MSLKKLVKLVGDIYKDYPTLILPKEVFDKIKRTN